jgi:HEAT repeat protein
VTKLIRIVGVLAAVMTLTACSKSGAPSKPGGHHESTPADKHLDKGRQAALAGQDQAPAKVDSQKTAGESEGDAYQPFEEPSPQEVPGRLQSAMGRYYALVSADERSEVISEIGSLAEYAERKSQVTDALRTLFLTEANPAVRVDIVTELGDIKDPSAAGAILLGLDSKQPEEVREAATEAMVSLLQGLVEAEHPAAFDQMVHALQPSLPRDVREAAIDGLEELKDKRAVPILQQFLQDDDAEIREAAADAVDWLSDE